MVRLRFGALVAALAMVVTACAGTTPSAAPASSGPGASGEPSVSASASPDAAAPKEGGTLVVGLEGDINRTDAAIIDDLNSSYVLQQMVEGLVTLAPGTGDEIVPALATEWDLADDAVTYTFKIREGVKFHDGTALDAAAVKYNFDRWLNIPQAYIDLSYTYYIDSVIGRGDTSFVESVEAPDATTVVVKLRNPNSAFLLQMTLTPFGIQSPTALEAGNANAPDFKDNKYAVGVAPTAVGTGPFVFKEWVNGDHITIEKNPDYWDKAAGGPYLDAITFRALPDTTARLNDLTSGGIDVAQVLAPVDLPSLQGDTEVSIIDRGSACNLGVLAMNHSFKPFDNLQIRQAVAAARRPAVPRRRLLWRRRFGRRQLDPARIAVREGPRLPGLRPRGGQGADRRIGRGARGPCVRLLVPIQHDPCLHARPQGPVRRHAYHARGCRVQAQPQDRALGSGVPRRLDRRRLRDVPGRLELRLVRHRQLPVHGVLRVPGWQAEPLVRLPQR